MLDPGSPVGRYIVDAWLGEGSVGTVYRVRDAHGGAFAIKVQTHGGDEGRARFRQEAEIQLALVHPHIVRGREILEVSGRPALVMDYVHGLPLDDWLALNPNAGLGERDRLARQILQAVAFAHDRGLVHRNLEPANVLVEQHEDGPRARVTDFGLAKLQSSPSGGSGADETDAGAALGSPRYAAPEQLKDAKRVDARADVWSLGALLFELYTGRKAFDQRGLAEVASAVAAARYPDPGELGAPARVRDAIRGALQVDPAARFPDCRALLAALALPPEDPMMLPALGSPILPTTLATSRSPTLVPPSLSPFSLPPQPLGSQPDDGARADGAQAGAAGGPPPVGAELVGRSSLGTPRVAAAVAQPPARQLAGDFGPSWLAGVHPLTIAWGAALLMVLGMFAVAVVLLGLILLL